MSLHALRLSLAALMICAGVTGAELPPMPRMRRREPDPVPPEPEAPETQRSPSYVGTPVDFVTDTAGHVTSLIARPIDRPPTREEARRMRQAARDAARRAR